jgi:hypothetical protein
MIRDRVMTLALLGVLFTSLVTTHGSRVPVAVQVGTDSAFLGAIHRVGIVAPDEQAIQVGNQVARLADSGSSSEEINGVVRNFGIYDRHVDAFTAAAMAAYGP